MQKKIIPSILAIALLILGVFSVLSIRDLQGTGRVINYAGVVRGATQRLIKQELNGQPNDTLISQLNSILEELSTGNGSNDISRLNDSNFQNLLSEMKKRWSVMQTEIDNVRQSGDPSYLYTLSEDYFELADHAVFAAEIYSEHQVHRAATALMAFSAVIFFLVALLARHESIQNSRRKELHAAEDANRKKSEYLAQMSEDLRAPMNDISELMYVADMETYELLFLNDAGRKTFHVDDISNKKCYKVLQGLDGPCSFCNTSSLSLNKIHTWEYTNPLTQRHYLLKDRLLRWEGRFARMEIAFDITEAEAEKQALKNALDAEKTIMECVRILYREHDLNHSIPVVLKHLGQFLSADRSYLFLIRDHLLYNDFEWCKDGIEPQKDLLQALPLSLIGRWIPQFEQQECVILDDTESIKQKSPDEYSILCAQDIHSLVAAPLEQNGRLIGYIGVDNPPPDKIRTIVSLLQTLCYFIMQTYRQRESELELSHLSYYDSLTSFSNRNRYMEDSAILSNHTGSLGIVFLDVNGLKDINDQHGHTFGDKVLVECARQMKEVFEHQPADFYRIGGDEFVIICLDISQDIFEERISVLRRCFRLNPLCRAAIGAKWTDHHTDLQQVIASADAQMYEDKKKFYRKNPISTRYRYHNDELFHLADSETLKNEIAQKHFIVYLQPKISSFDSSVLGAEALIRYQTSSGSLVLPSNFLPLLEESQSIRQIDFYVFEFVCAQIKKWIQQKKQVVPVSVNFSRSSLAQPNFVSQLTALCHQYDVDKKYLEIEITETIREADSKDFKVLIDDLRHAGFMVSIDDFGTEYANLALLSTVDFDVLKLDKSLVEDVARNSKAKTVVESIVSICKHLDIQVIAEGIETKEQLEFLQSCGVELVQGFLFSKPIPVEEYEKKYI